MKLQGEPKRTSRPRAIDIARADTPEPLISETLGIDAPTKKLLFDLLDLDTSSRPYWISNIASHAISLITFFPEERQKIKSKMDEK